MNKLNCQYNKKDCQKIAEFQHTLKLDFVRLDKGLICANCKLYLEKKQTYEK
jgi:hypothetical protein